MVGNRAPGTFALRGDFESAGHDEGIKLLTGKIAKRFIGPHCQAMLLDTDPDDRF